ncbi:MAG: peptidylprolyl isomerase [Actinobacteria bacterium]|nr:peptidylprolyl isomerase [Actinomycetota bacterium]
MPNSKQRREQARRHLERQLVRRQQRELRRRKINLIATVVGVLVLFAVVIGTVLLLSNGKNDSTANPAASDSASPSASGSPLPSRKPSPIAARAAKKTSGPCGYAEDATKLTAGNLFDVGLPPDPKPTPTGNATAVFDTNQGAITVTLDGASAPCNVQSIKYLISKKFYDNTACPRSVNSGIFVVQCGDPSGTTGGGPTYTTKDENLSKVSYTEGTLAMANSGPNTNGSQFFIMHADYGLAPNYTIFGRVTAGLEVVDKIATAPTGHQDRPVTPTAITGVSIEER